MKKKKSVHNLTAYVLRRGNSMDDSYGNPAFWTSVGQGKGEQVVVVFFYIKNKLQKKSVAIALGYILFVLGCSPTRQWHVHH